MVMNRSPWITYGMTRPASNFGFAGNSFKGIILLCISWVITSSLSHKMHCHYNDVIMGTIASQITSITIVYSTVYSDADQRKYQSSASLAFVRGIHRGPVNSMHKCPVFHIATPISVAYTMIPVKEFPTYTSILRPTSFPQTCRNASFGERRFPPISPLMTLFGANLCTPRYIPW